MLHGLFQVPALLAITGSLQQGILILFKGHSTKNPKLIMIKIRQSKTDPFRQGVTLYLGKTESLICPIMEIFPFWALRGKQPGPLFILKDGWMFTRQISVQLWTPSWKNYNWIALQSCTRVYCVVQSLTGLYKVVESLSLTKCHLPLCSKIIIMNEHNVSCLNGLVISPSGVLILS